ncbi:kinase-like domain-containing protein, partial [Gigaspora rosea]
MRNITHCILYRDSDYGKCAYCNEDNTQPAWCHSCDPDITTKWTSRNKDIDDCMETFQLRALSYEDVIEWIPFDRLSEIKKIGKGGFGTVYSATWLDGIRKVEIIKEGNNYICKRVRVQSSTFKSLMICKLNLYKLAIYGITQNTETKEYLMVFQYANNGSLYKYLRNNFCNLTWLTKLEILRDISHEPKSYIADLGLSRKTDENALEGDIYGVMPYVAPEVLSGEQQFTQAADIYGFGVIMSE